VTDWNQVAAEAALASEIIALMAFVAAIVAVAVTLNINSAQQHTLELQRQQFEEQQRRARRELAAKISFFVETNNDNQYELKVINASDYPIHAVTAVFKPRTPRATAVAVTLHLLPTRPTPYTMQWRLKELPPELMDPNTARGAVYGVELWFEDSNGTYWRRTNYGTLAELTDAEQTQLGDLLVSRVRSDFTMPG
jgi:type II secretory pathway pseudopilin PulG